MKKPKTLEEFFSEDIKSGKNEQVFEKSFYNERNKDLNKSHRINETRRKIYTKLGFNKEEPYSFFAINRSNIKKL